MKVKWTTITEDEATWPVPGVSVVFENINLPTSEKVFQGYIDGLKMVHAPEFVSDRPIKIGENKQWRPMPKPSKKQVKKESPWKSTKIKPKLGQLLIVRNYGIKISGIYCYKKIGDNLIEGITDLGFSSWTEWMEIPE